MVNLKIDGRPIAVEPGTTVLEAAKQLGIKIPTLCYLKEINKIGACRMCLVEATGTRGLQTSCTLPCAEGMEVGTNTSKVKDARKLVLDLLLSDHNIACPTCVRADNCELLRLSRDAGIMGAPREGVHHPERIDITSASLALDASKCVLCQRCVAVCREVQGVSAISLINRGFHSGITPFFESTLDEAACTYCGQCTLVCPTGALTEHDNTAEVWAALGDPSKHVIVQTAPAVRVAIGETCGLPAGTVSTGQMVAALRAMGFDQVFDTNFAADVTIMEEASELVERITHGGVLPMITSCSPGWVKYAEHFYPDRLQHLSSCKSPHEMLGALAKSYYAEQYGIDPASIIVVSVMPCTAKKFEASRPELAGTGYPDVDLVITTRELGRMIRQANLDLTLLPDEHFDAPLGISSGAGAIFGTTGGVMEAALRTAAAWLEGDEVGRLEFTEVRGLEGVREATVKVGALELKVALANGLASAGRLMDKVATGASGYHFIEIMGCPGGCIGGGGQPIPAEGPEGLERVRRARIKAIYAIDQNSAVRRSHENPAVVALYQDFLGRPLGETSHHLLHTHYVRRSPSGGDRS